MRRAQHISFLGDVSEVYWREPASVCPAAKGRACKGDIARGRDAGSRCRRGVRIQNAAALRAGVPPDLRCQPYGVSIRGSALKASGHPVPDEWSPLSQTPGMEPKKR